MGNTSFAIMRVEKVKSFDGAKALENHNTREMDVPHAMPEYEHLNETIKGTDNIKTDIQDILDAKGITKMRKGGVIALDFLLSASPEYFGMKEEGYIPNPDDKRVKDWVEGAKNFLFDEFGEDCVAQIHLHMDEKTPHMHAVCVPVVRNHSTTPKDKRRSNRTYDPHKLSANNWVNGIVKMRTLQDTYYESVKHCGLERGVKTSKGSEKLYQERASRQLEEERRENERVQEQLKSDMEKSYQIEAELRLQNSLLHEELERLRAEREADEADYVDKAKMLAEKVRNTAANSKILNDELGKRIFNTKEQIRLAEDKIDQLERLKQASRNAEEELRKMKPLNTPKKKDTGMGMG